MMKERLTISTHCSYAGSITEIVPPIMGDMHPFPVYATSLLIHLSSNELTGKDARILQ